MTPAPNRRWFRFAYSLRTLFVVMTLLCVLIGRQLHVVSERKNLLRQVESSAGHVHLWTESAVYVRQIHGPKIPVWREWLGDKAFIQIELKRADPAFHARLSKWFPEAYIIDAPMPKTR